MGLFALMSCRGVFDTTLLPTLIFLQFARIYTPAVLVACALLAFLPWAWVAANERSDWVYLSLQVLVTACPCALVLSTPATVVCALARAAGKGVLIKSGAALEALRRVSCVLASCVCHSIC